MTNITNNYTYINSDNGGSEDDGGDSDTGATLGDALLAWVEGLKELLAFVLNLLGEAVNLIASFLNDALELLTGLTDSFGGFTDLLGELFSFIPQELLDAMSAGIILILVLGVIKALK